MAEPTTTERLEQMRELAESIVEHDGVTRAEQGFQLALLFEGLALDMAAAGFPHEPGPPEDECDCARYPDGITCPICKLSTTCDGCCGSVMFENLKTGELLCPVCTAVDAGEHLPAEPIASRIGEGVARVLSFLMLAVWPDLVAPTIVAAWWVGLAILFYRVVALGLTALVSPTRAEPWLDLIVVLAAVAAAGVVIVGVRWTRKVGGASR
jgi:hypothetical protein